MNAPFEVTLARGLRQIASGIEALAGAIETRGGITAAQASSSWEWSHIDDLGTHEQFDFPPARPGGGPWRETYEGGFIVFEGRGPAGAVRMGIGETTRNDPDVSPTFGRVRRYRVLFLMRGGSKQPLAEFCSVDDAGEGDEAARGPFVSVIRGKGPSGRQMYDVGEPLPMGYGDLPVVEYRDQIRQPGAYRKAAVLAGADEVETMLAHGLAQAQQRYDFKLG